MARRTPADSDSGTTTQFRRAVPRVAPPLVPYLVVGLAVFGMYSLVTAWSNASRRAAADRHAHNVFDAEQRLHLDPERSLNSWLVHHAGVQTVANYEYALGYVVAAFGALLWVYLRRPDHFRWACTSFLLTNVLGIVGFALYPLTPPRLLPAQGFTDTVEHGHTFASWGSPLVSSANELAAMPSLHVAWALWVSVVLARTAKSWRTQSLGVLHLMGTLFVVMATANHYLLDAVGGAAVVAISTVAVTAVLDRDVDTRSAR